MSGWKRRVDLGIGHAEADMGDVVKVGDRVVARLIHVDLPGRDELPRWEFTIDSSDGVPRVTRALFERVDGGREVEAKDFAAAQRRMPEWREAIVTAFRMQTVETEDGVTAYLVDLSDEKDAWDLRSVLADARAADHRKINDALLRDVAQIYNAQKRGGLKAVQAAYGVHERTAAKYVEAARNTQPPLIAPREKGK